MAVPELAHQHIDTQLGTQSAETTSQFVALGSERIVIPDIRTNVSLAVTLDPNRIAQRQALEHVARSTFATMPEDLNDQVRYLAATGIEFRYLMDSSEIRTGETQWVVIDELSKSDARFRRENPAYNDGLRQDLHNRIASDPIRIRTALDAVGLYDLRLKDQVEDRLYIDEFPYFNDVLAAAENTYNMDWQTVGALALLHTENRIARMYRNLQADVRQVNPRAANPKFETPLRVREALGKYGDMLRADGSVKEGRLSRALRRHEQLSALPLPVDLFAVDLGLQANEQVTRIESGDIQIFPSSESSASEAA